MSASIHPGQDPKKIGIQPQREVNPPLRNPFNEPISKIICLETAWKLAGREQSSRYGPKIAHSACWPIGLDRKQLSLVREEGQIADYAKKQQYSLLETKNMSNKSLAIPS